MLQQRTEFSAEYKRKAGCSVNIELDLVTMRLSNLRFFSITVLLFAIFSMLMLSVSAAGDQEVAASSISEAEWSMAQAYEAVLDAERFDADVSGLLVQLYDATELLSKARMAFDVGDFDEAKGYAESTSEVGYDVVSEAELLEIEAANARVHSSWVFLGISVLGVSVVVVASVVGYRFFKRRYYRRLSKMKPRVE